MARWAVLASEEREEREEAQVVQLQEEDRLQVPARREDDGEWTCMKYWIESCCSAVLLSARAHPWSNARICSLPAPRPRAQGILRLPDHPWG